MKKLNKFFIPLMAVGMLASCSSESEPVNNGGEKSEGSLRYLAVNIVNPANETRVTDEDYSYENGTEAEDKVTSYMFILIGSDGKLQNGNITDLNWENNLYNQSTTYPNNVENISNAVILVDGSEVNSTPTELVVILNPTFSFETVKDYNKAQLLDYVSDFGSHNEGNFVMSNSGYYNGTTQVRTTAISPNDFGLTATDAKNKAVNVYVERVVAKVTTTAISEGNNKGTGENEIDGKKISLKVTVDAIGVTNYNNKSYLVKNLTGWESNGANWSGTFRSFWATTNDANTYRQNPSYNDLVSQDETTLNIGQHANGNMAKTFYVQENTIDTEKPEYRPCVIVAAHITNDDGQAVELIRIANQYYTKSEAAKLVGKWLLSNSGIGIANGTDLASLTDEDIEWIQPEGTTGLKDYEAYPQVKTTSTKTFINKQGTEVSINDINTNLKNNDYKAWYWNGGKCYYFANITDSNIGKPGLVRNTVYKMTLGELEGLGTPIVDPDKDIIPEIPNPDPTLWSLAAKVNILRWRIVSNTVDFNKTKPSQSVNQ